MSEDVKIKLCGKSKLINSFKLQRLLSDKINQSQKSLILVHYSLRL